MVAKVLLVIIVCLGLFLRLYQVAENPPGFFADEAANGFNAYRLLMTGADEYGVKWPFYFRSFGDYRNPVTIYSMIPAIAIWGLNEFSVRITMVFFGTSTIWLVYLLTQELFKEEKEKKVIGLCSALLLAISPWHIHFSRTGFEFITLPFYLVLGLWLFCGAMNSERGFRWLLGSIFAFAICFYTYYPIQIVLIPFLLGLFFIYKRALFLKFNKRQLVILLCLYLFGLAPFIYGITSGKALTRFQNVSPLGIKPWREVIIPMIKTYRDHFSLEFLFTKGDVGMPGHFITRHSAKNMGELYKLQLPFLIIGFTILAVKQTRVFIFFVWWLILYPIGSTVVGEGPFAHRSIFGVIPFQILTAYGLTTIWSWLLKFKVKFSIINLWFKMYATLVLTVAVLISVNMYMKEYFIEYPLYSADFWGWQYGPREIISYFKSMENDYDELIMSHEFNAPEIFLKFYDPDHKCLNCLIGDISRFNPQKRQLFALSNKQLEEARGMGYEILVRKLIYYPNGKVGFVIGELELRF